MVKVSIIVPVYNVEKYLRRCLDSLVNQTLPEIQIIVVNDGSPDNSQDIIDEYVKAYPDKVEGYVKPNGGLSDARNFAFPYVKGEFIGFVDSDDYISPEMYEKLYEKAVEEESDIVVCGYYAMNEVTGGCRIMQTGYAQQFGFSLEENHDILHLSAPYAWNKLYRTRLFEETGIRFPVGRLFEDIPTMYPLFLHAKKISKVDEPLYYYVVKREGAITATFDDRVFDCISSLAMLNDYYIEQGCFEEYRSVLLYLNLRHVFARFKDFQLYNKKLFQFKVLNAGFRHLDQYFPGWKNFDRFFKRVYGHKKLKLYLVKHKIGWTGFILIPNTWFKPLGLYRNLLKNMFKRHLHNRNYYAFCSKHMRVDKKVVLFESFSGKEINDSPLALCRELAARGGYKLYFTSKRHLAKSARTFLDSQGLYEVEVAITNSGKYHKLLATAGYLVNNVTFPAYYVRRPEQVYLNTWHGTPLKSLGKKMAGSLNDMINTQRNFLQATHLLEPNVYTYEHIFEDYTLSKLYTGKVLLEGYPRNSIFCNEEERERIRSKYIPEGMETFAYMPTWRGSDTRTAAFSKYAQDLRNILHEIDETLTDDQRLYVNLHQLLKGRIKLGSYKHIQRFPKDVDNYTFLNAVDCLITDYSSVMFDYSVSGRPVYLFMYDYESYMANRGMYMDVRELPFPIAYDLETLKGFIQDRSNVPQIGEEALEGYRKAFIAYDSLNATKQVADYIFEGKEPTFEVIDYSKNKDIPRTVFLPGKMIREADAEKMYKVSEMQNPVVVVRKGEFGRQALNILESHDEENFAWTVSAQFMKVTGRESRKIILAAYNKKHKTDYLYKTEIERILPNLKLTEAVCDNNSFYAQSVAGVVNSQEK